MEAQLRSAREASQQTFNPLSDAIQVDAPRFFVQFGWNVLRMDTQALANSYLLRGEITPCRSYPQLAPLIEIREGELIPGSETADKDGRTLYGKYWRRAHFEAERLIEGEQSSSFRQGLYEIKSLTGVNSTLYERIDLNQIFYTPFTLDTLPEKNIDLIAHLERRIAEITLSGVDGVPAHLQDVIKAIGKELIAAAEYGDRIQQQRIEFTHSCMKLPPSDPSGLWKREYDLIDEEMLVRTGKPRVHSADVTTAQALDRLIDRDDNVGMNRLAEALMQQAAQQKQLIDMLLAEREEKTPPRRGRPAKDD